eukprot:CAMPEP_0170450310 /NCGR_PEP_ID=MMETSP0117_2-20130122/51703_1 /TAXON_ID=400756 /ORGANISM="Durinskia baltica, Strain CSIRO CS-38" /LENGTH=547 /DNA_ID=CAMNT_0010711597 /DNA_START=123 /DNA_END=1763 /DNA_ORIENTATION=+
MASSLRVAQTKALITKCIPHELYPSHLRQFYGINAKLRKEGISAPQDVSVANTKRLYDIIGKPLDSIPTLHVGGTNGKGTTSFKLSEILKGNGIRTGLFVSPHLASFRERIQVDSELLPEESFVRNLKTLLDLCTEHNIAATEFELTFLMAALHFQQSNCEAVVLEVGLGGEYDATNVVSTMLSIICSVSLDHTRILGSTVEAIARNKAGIFKYNQPALIGPGVPLSVTQEMAGIRGSNFYTYDSAEIEFKPRLWKTEVEFKPRLWKQNLDLSAGDSEHNVQFSPMVDTDALNANIALLGLHLFQKHHPHAFPTLDLTSEATAKGLDARPPCRWEEHVYPQRQPSLAVTDTAYELATESAIESATVVAATGAAAHKSESLREPSGVDEIDVILDMGHNPAALGALARRIAYKFPGRNVRMVYAMSRDKNVRTCLQNVLAVIPPTHVHFVQSKNFRAISREDLSAMFREEMGCEMTQLSSTGIQDTLKEVSELLITDKKSLAKEQGGDCVNRPVLIVCGTGYIMPEARAFLGIIEPRDELDLKRDQVV